MAELADALGSGPSDRKVVEVRVLLSAPTPAVSFWPLALSLKRVASGFFSRACGQAVRAAALRDSVLADFVEQGFIADLQQCRGLFAIPVRFFESPGDRFGFRLIFGIA